MYVVMGFDKFSVKSSFFALISHFLGSFHSRDFTFLSKKNTRYLITESLKFHPGYIPRVIIKSVSMMKPGINWQEVIQLKSPISLKLVTNMGHDELSIVTEHKV